MHQKKQILSSKLGIAPNKTAAAARLGLSVEIVRAAQRAGCPACQASGKIDCDALKIWLDENADTIGDDSKIDYEFERAFKIRIERQIKQVELGIKRRELIHVDEVRAAITRTIAAVKGQFQSLGSSVVPLAMLKLSLNKSKGLELQNLIDARTHSIFSNLHQDPWAIKPPQTTARRKTTTKKASSKKSPAKRGKSKRQSLHRNGSKLT